MKLTNLSLAAGLLALSFASANAMPLCGLGKICQLPNGPSQVQPANPIYQVKPIVLKPIKMPPVPINPLPAPPKPVDPGPSFGINVNVGGGYDGAYGGPGATDYVSCHEAKQIVREHGYRHVQTQDCNGDDYSFLARRKGQAWIVQVSDTGEIVNRDLAY